MRHIRTPGQLPWPSVLACNPRDRHPLPHGRAPDARPPVWKVRPWAVSQGDSRQRARAEWAARPCTMLVRTQSVFHVESPGGAGPPLSSSRPALAAVTSGPSAVRASVCSGVSVPAWSLLCLFPLGSTPEASTLRAAGSLCCDWRAAGTHSGSDYQARSSEGAASCGGSWHMQVPGRGA